MVRSQYAELLITSPDATDHRIRDMTEYGIASVVSYKERKRLYNLLADQLAQIPQDLDNAIKGQQARRVCIRIWGEIASWYEDTLSIVSYNQWGTTDEESDWNDRIEGQGDPPDAALIPMIIGGPAMRARPGFFAAYMAIRGRFASLLSQIPGVTDPRIRDLTEFAISSVTDRERREAILGDLDRTIEAISRSDLDNITKATKERSACIHVWGDLSDWYDNLAGVIKQNEFSSIFQTEG